MEKIKEKLFCLFFAFVLAFAGCAPGENSSGSSSGGDIMQQEQISIIENGKSDYKVVISQQASECEAFAAEELVSFLRQITGCLLPIENDRRYTFNPNDKVISIGATKILATSGIDTASMYAKLNLTGFYIEGTGNTVIVDAYNDVGVLYGVYELLEKYGGVRFVTEDFTHVPESADFSVDEGEQIEAPAFQMRTYLSQIFYTDKLFMARMRLGNEHGNADETRYGGSNRQWLSDSHYTHGTIYICDPAIYMQDYPQMFNIVGGQAKEICMTYGITEDGHIDENIPVSAATVALEQIKKYLAENPDVVYFFLGQNDNYDYCVCDTCKRRAAQYGDKRSSLLIIFMNAILEKLIPYAEETWPGRDIRMGTFAYHYTEEPPVSYDEATGVYTPLDPLVVPNEKLYVRIAPIRANFLYAMNDDRQSQTYLSVFRGWQAITKNFWIWDYATNYSDFNFVFPNIAAMKENYLYYRDIGVTYCMTQANHRNVNDFQDRLKCYVASKLMWNPDLDADELTNEFFTLYFGKYAPALREFWELWSRHLCEIGEDPDIRFYLAENSMYNALEPINYPIALLERSLQLINGAIELNQQDESITTEERNTMRERLLGALVVPERMILRNITDYYGTSRTAEFASSYFGHIDEIGQAYLSEQVLISTERAKYGL